MTSRSQSWLGWRVPLLSLVLLWHTTNMVWAQGQDGLPAERDLQVIAELLPGRYDNWNQHYFDGRRQRPENQRHARLHTRVQRIEAPTFGPHAFYAEDHLDDDPAKVVRRRVWSFQVDPPSQALRMRTYWLDDRNATRYVAALTDGSVWRDANLADFRVVPGCDVLWRRELGQFVGASQTTECRFQSAGLGEVLGEYRYVLAPAGIAIHEVQRDRRGRVVAGHASGEPFELQRARLFKCNADIPGVGGGAAIPFERYSGLELHDKGGSVWFETREAVPRELQLSLSSVVWPLNNETGAFTRNSLVLYVNERIDGSVKNLAYSGTEPRVERLFINLKWILVNCYMQFNRDVRPEF
jgi:CpeT/CpcT family (DUF1001)